MTDVPQTDAERDADAQRIYDAYTKADAFTRARIRQNFGSDLVERGRELANKPPSAV